MKTTTDSDFRSTPRDHCRAGSPTDGRGSWRNHRRNWWGRIRNDGLRRVLSNDDDKLNNFEWLRITSSKTQQNTISSSAPKSEVFHGKKNIPSLFRESSSVAKRRNFGTNCILNFYLFWTDNENSLRNWIRI